MTGQLKLVNTESLNSQDMAILVLLRKLPNILLMLEQQNVSKWAIV